MPDVTFNGPRDSVLPTLQKFDNFKPWSLGIPKQSQDFLTEIDVYTLLSGIDCSPLTT